MPETIGLVPFWLVKATVLALGLSFGSFANVLVHRVPRGLSIVRPGSACPGCGASIRWFDNIPVLSWVLLLGRCRRCGTGISLRYPLVELCGGVLSLASLFLAVERAGPRADLAGVAALWFFAFAFCYLLLVITFVDLEHWRIPPHFAVPGAVIGVIAAFVAGDRTGVSWADSLIGLAVGGLGLEAIAFLWWLATKREGLGFGDTFLLGMIGATLGWVALPFVLLLGSIQGLMIAIPLSLAGKVAPPPWEREEAEAGPGAVPVPDPAPAPEPVPVPEPAPVPVPEPVPVPVPVPAPVPAPDASPGAVRRILRAPVPFGPFLALGALEWLFFGDLLLAWLVPG